MTRHSQRKNPRRFRRLAALVAPSLLLAGGALAHFGPVPISLVGAPVPQVPGLLDGPDPIVVDEDKAIALGKALFWDMNCRQRRHRLCVLPLSRGRRSPRQESASLRAESSTTRTSTHRRSCCRAVRTTRSTSPTFRSIRRMRRSLPRERCSNSSDDVVSSSGTFGGVLPRRGSESRGRRLL